MIQYTKFVLENGLRVLVHQDKDTPMVAVNLLYKVGSKNETPDRTGFAHLFEHLMFSGSKNAPDFDDLIQRAGGDNNAFTNNDITNFYEVLPVENLEVALFLEADRMEFLNINEKSLGVQKKVVVEEFKETCLNKPYGDIWHIISDMVYKKHPYRWPTIGIKPEHISEASLEDVTQFYKEHYNPDNSILVIAGNVEVEATKALVEKRFGHIASPKRPANILPFDGPQKKENKVVKYADVPHRCLYLAFPMPSRLHEDYVALDLLTDILANGDSSRLVKKLYKEEEQFSTIDAYLTGTFDPGIFVIEGKPDDSITIEEAENLIWKEIHAIIEKGISEYELEKCKNRFESTLVFSEMNLLNKATNLAYFECIGDVELINSETELYNKITIEDIQKVAVKYLNRNNVNTLHYLSSQKKK